MLLYCLKLFPENKVLLKMYLIWLKMIEFFHWFKVLLYCDNYLTFCLYPFSLSFFEKLKNSKTSIT